MAGAWIGSPGRCGWKQECHFPTDLAAGSAARAPVVFWPAEVDGRNESGVAAAALQEAGAWCGGKVVRTVLCARSQAGGRTFRTGDCADHLGGATAAAGSGLRQPAAALDGASLLAVGGACLRARGHGTLSSGLLGGEAAAGCRSPGFRGRAELREEVRERLAFVGDGEGALRG